MSISDRSCPLLTTRSEPPHAALTTWGVICLRDHKCAGRRQIGAEAVPAVRPAGYRATTIFFTSTLPFISSRAK